MSEVKFVRTIGVWEAIPMTGIPTDFEVVVVVRDGAIPEIGETYDIPEIGPAKVLGAWRQRDVPGDRVQVQRVLAGSDPGDLVLLLRVTKA